MKILLVYPQCPDSYWSFRHALRFISKKAALPPLGLITVSALFPPLWKKKLVDMNVDKLNVSDLLWADYVFISAMVVQKDSVQQVIELCRKHGVKMVAGGPLFTQEPENYPEIDHFVLNEAEITLPLFLRDLESGQPTKKTYSTPLYADIRHSPAPDYHLLNMKAYAFMNLQVSRGCPFACDFCEITALLGHKVRMKDTLQILKELQRLYDLRWRGNVFVVDDNFIGNKKEIKTHLLPAMKQWMVQHKYPFVFNTQTSINLADDDDLMRMMTEAGFNSTFIGIETVEEKSLHDCNKVQNNHRDMISSVKKIQSRGLQVSGGFIVGFDSDSPGVFQRQADFIQKSGIVSAMVGLLNAPKNTRLYERLRSENRLTVDATGSNTDFSMNFIPKMKYSELMDGYRNIISDIYSVKPYYKRIRQFILNYRQNRTAKSPKFGLAELKGFVKSMFIIGMANKGRREYWKFLLWTLLRYPGSFSNAVTFTVYGFHFRTVYGLRN